MVCINGVCDINQSKALDIKIIAVLNYCGYSLDDTDHPYSVPRPLTEQLTELFLDYVNSGIWADMTMDEAKELIADGSIGYLHMINALRNVR